MLGHFPQGAGACLGERQPGGPGAGTTLRDSCPPWTLWMRLQVVMAWTVGSKFGLVLLAQLLLQDCPGRSSAVKPERNLLGRVGRRAH